MLALMIVGYFPKWKISKNLIYDFMLALCLVNDDENDTVLISLLIPILIIAFNAMVSPKPRFENDNGRFCYPTKVQCISCH